MKYTKEILESIANNNSMESEIDKRVADAAEKALSVINYSIELNSLLDLKVETEMRIGKVMIFMHSENLKEGRNVNESKNIIIDYLGSYMYFEIANMVSGFEGEWIPKISDGHLVLAFREMEGVIDTYKAVGKCVDQDMHFSDDYSSALVLHGDIGMLHEYISDQIRKLGDRGNNSSEEDDSIDAGKDKGLIENEKEIWKSEQLRDADRKAAEYNRAIPLSMNDEVGLIAIIMYASELTDRNPGLDFTYDTVDLLLPALKNLFDENNRYAYANEVEQNTKIINKTAAAYLLLLAANEHNLQLACRSYDDSEIKRYKLKGSLWADHFMVSFEDSNVNLLKSLRKVAQPKTDSDGNRSIDIDAEYMVRTYRKIVDDDRIIRLIPAKADNVLN